MGYSPEKPKKQQGPDLFGNLVTKDTTIVIPGSKKPKLNWLERLLIRLVKSVTK